MCPGRLPGVRVRTFELRLIAAAMTAGWTLTAGLVLLGYRPGGPVDLAVGLVAFVPALISLAGLRWPPVARGGRAFGGMAALGLGVLLVLIPSIAEVNGQLQGGGIQTLLPSVEAAYPWALALVGTSLFAGLGIARRLLGGMAMRRPRAMRGLTIAVVLSLVAGSGFTAVAMANEFALRDRPAAFSRFGPTDAQTEPPACDDRLAIGTSARVEIQLVGRVDGRSIGTVDLTGERDRTDFRWLAYAATTRELGLRGAARIGSDAWLREPFAGWRRADLADVLPGTLDAEAFGAVLSAGERATAEQLGVAVIEGARARLCRVAIDGEGFRDGFPQVEWLVGDADLSRWRGQLDYWVFLDSQVGRIAGEIEGDASGIREGALLASIQVSLNAVNRGADVRLLPPGR